MSKRTRNIPDTVTLVANEQRDYDQVGHSFLLVSNSLATDVHIGIDDDTPHAWPVGDRYIEPTPDGTFRKVRLANPTAGPMTISFVISFGIIENISAIVSGVVLVDDSANGIATPARVLVLPRAGFLINNAAAVNVGGGVVGIPVTGQPFVTGESITITNTVNYDGVYPVLASSGANQVDITAAYVVEVFDGVDDTIARSTIPSIAADSTRKFVDIHNHGAWDLYYGDANVDAANNRGVPVTPGNGVIIPNTGQLYLDAPTAAGKTGVLISYANHTRT